MGFDISKTENRPHPTGHINLPSEAKVEFDGRNDNIYDHVSKEDPQSVKILSFEIQKGMIGMLMKHQHYF